MPDIPENEDGGFKERNSRPANTVMDDPETKTSGPWEQSPGGAPRDEDLGEKIQREAGSKHPGPSGSENAGTPLPD